MKCGKRKTDLILPVIKSQTQSIPSCEPLPDMAGLNLSMNKHVIGPQ